MDVEMIVGELPVFINNDQTSEGFIGRAHIRIREDTSESTILIKCESAAARALVDMMLNYTPTGLSFIYVKNTPDERNDR